MGTPQYLSEAQCAEPDALDSEDYRRRLLAEMKTSSEVESKG